MKFIKRGLIILLLIYFSNAQNSQNVDSIQGIVNPTNLEKNITVNDLSEQSNDPINFNNDSTLNDDSNLANEDENSTNNEQVEDSFDNPFLSTDEQNADVQENETITNTGSQNEFVSDNNEFDDGGSSIDIIMDLSIGLSLPRFNVKPNNISTEGKPNFLFRTGVIIPFTELFFGGVSLQYLQLSFNLSEKDTIYAQNKKVHLKTGKEALTFLSLPCKLGMRFDLGSMLPYFYMDIEPTVLTGGYQNNREEVTTYFADSSKQVVVFINDVGVTDKRNMILPFVGAGCGLEINYGYGSVYFDVSVQYNPLEFDKDNSYDAVFKRTNCKAFYFPVLIGIRFYL